jgi:hypothetical protein
MRNNTILTRVSKIEQKIGKTGSDLQYRVLLCSGPRSMSTGEILVQLGYEITPRTIQVRFVPSHDAPDLPIKDHTRPIEI